MFVSLSVQFSVAHCFARTNKPQTRPIHTLRRPQSRYCVFEHVLLRASPTAELQHLWRRGLSTANQPSLEWVRHPRSLVSAVLNMCSSRCKYLGSPTLEHVKGLVNRGRLCQRSVVIAVTQNAIETTGEMLVLARKYKSEWRPQELYRWHDCWRLAPQTE
jgi:hypothetical protein